MCNEDLMVGGPPCLHSAYATIALYGVRLWTIMEREYGDCQGRGVPEGGEDLLCSGFMQLVGEPRLLRHVSSCPSGIGGSRICPSRMEPCRSSRDICQCAPATAKAVPFHLRKRSRDCYRPPPH